MIRPYHQVKEFSFSLRFIGELTSVEERQLPAVEEALDAPRSSIERRRRSSSFSLNHIHLSISQALNMALVGTK